MKLIVKKASTSKILHLFISDSSSTIGAGLTGLVYNSASLTAYYVRPGSATPTAISLATIGTLGTYAASGFKEYDATNLPGVYEFDPPDAVLATGVDHVVIMLKGATNMAPLLLEIQLVDNIEKDTYDRIGAPAGASIAADLVTIDNYVDQLEMRLTGTRAGYLDELAAANLPSDIDDILLDTGTNGVLLAATATSAQLVDDIWDEILTGATHNVATSAGKRLREIAATIIINGTAQAGGDNTITISAAASPTDFIYNRNQVVIMSGLGVGQTRSIADYNGTTKVITVSRDWDVNPNNTSEYVIVAADIPFAIDNGIAQGATSTTLTLHATASSQDSIYNDNTVFILGETGEHQSRYITAYNGTTKVITITPAWTVIPTSSSIYVVFTNTSLNREAVSEAVVDSVWDEDLSTHTTSGTAGKIVSSIKKIVDAVLAFVS